MLVRTMWRRVRALGERPWNLLAISDLHLGADLRKGFRPETARARPIDRPLSEFLEFHATNRSNGKPWRLLLNGDIVDFVAITATPAEGEAVSFKVTPEEHEYGLAPEELKCVWKLQRTAERHPLVFDALGRFLQKGNSVHIIRGNHDAEWRFPAVQAELRRLMEVRSGVPRRKLERLVQFHDWFYLEPGFFYAEHGNAHDPYSVQSDFFDEHKGSVELPLSSQVLRYFVNRYTEQVEVADDVDAWGVKEYLDWVLKAGNPLRVAADYFVMVFRVIYPVVRQSLRLSRAFARAADKAIEKNGVRREALARRLLARFQGTEKQASLLAQVASRPAEQSLFDSMQLFYLDRMILAAVSLFAAWETGAAVQGFWAKGFALTVIGILFAALNAILGSQRCTDAHPKLLAAARRVAQIFDVKYVVMGHSHRPVDEEVGGSARYLNLGSWTGGRSEGFPHVAVVDGVAQLRRWKGPQVAGLAGGQPDARPEVAAVPATA